MEIEIQSNKTNLIYEDNPVEVYWTTILDSIEIESVVYKDLDIWDNLPIIHKEGIYELLKLSI